MADLQAVSAAWLEKQKAKLLEQHQVERKREQRARGVVVIKGTGHRPSKVRINPGRRDRVALEKAEAALREISRQLRALEEEQARRAAIEAPARA